MNTIIKNAFFGGSMKRGLTDILSLVGVYVASTIGAAFASGQEVVRFFTRHGVNGGKGTILSGFLFALAGIAVLDLILLKGVRGGSSLMQHIAGKRASTLMKGIVVFFSCCVFSSMVAGAAAVGEEMVGIPYQLGIFISLIICLLIVMKEVRAIASMGQWLAPLMIAGMLYIALSINQTPLGAFSYPTLNFPAGVWMPDAFLYVCYNSGKKRGCLALGAHWRSYPLHAAIYHQ